MSPELRSLRSAEAQLAIEWRLDAILEDLRPLRSYGRARGRRVLRLLHTLALWAPELLFDRAAARALGGFEPVRLPDDFRGGSSEDLLRHLFVGVRYPLPAFLLPLFADPDGPCEHGVRALVVLGRGGRVRDLRGTALPASFTRRMGHLLWLVPEAPSWSHAVRQAQVQALGGPPELADQLMETMLGRVEGRGGFSEPMIEWVVREGPLSREDLQLVVAFCWWRTVFGPPVHWSVGRRRMLEEARAHQEAEAHRRVRRRLPEGPYPDQVFDTGTRRWEVRQLRSSFELFLEGRVLRHCVGSYVDDAMAGHCVLLGLRRDGRRRVTLEVRHGELVTALGRANRIPQPDEAAAIHRWAGVVGVEVGALPGLAR